MTIPADRIVQVIPMDAFPGRWEELERHGWQLRARTWDAETQAWLCLFRHPRPTPAAVAQAVRVRARRDAENERRQG